MSKAVFLDTNVYLHYQPFDQINWLAVIGECQVTIVIPPITIRELNKHKELHPRSRVRKRASDVIKKFSALFESGPHARFRDGIDILLEDRDPVLDFTLHQLSREIQDDQLIASMIAFRSEKPEAEVILVTSDAGLTLIAKANRMRFLAVKLPDNLKLAEEPDPNQKRVIELEAELRELKRRVPQLSLAFEDSSQHCAFRLPRPVELTQKVMESNLARIKERHPKMEHPIELDKESSKHVASLADVLASLGSSLASGILPADIDEYNRQLDKFYEQHVQYLRQSIAYQNLQRRTIRLAIFVANDGTAPAEDVDVFMHFPDGFSLTNEQGFPEPPNPPKPPDKPMTQMQKMFEPFSRPMVSIPSLTSIVPDSVLPPLNTSAMNIKRTNSYDVNFHVRGIKHQLREAADDLYAVFASFEEAQSFRIDYKILAANVPYPVTGRLDVVVDKD